MATEAVTATPTKAETTAAIDATTAKPTIDETIVSTATAVFPAAAVTP